MIKDVIMREMEARGRGVEWLAESAIEGGPVTPATWSGSLFVTLIVALLRDFGAVQQMPSVVN
jgi:hypothetical protein